MCPVLWDISLAHYDSAIFERLGGEGIFKVFRYVDDYLAISQPPNELTDAAVANLLGACTAFSWIGMYP